MEFVYEFVGWMVLVSPIVLFLSMFIYKDPRQHWTAREYVATDKRGNSVRFKTKEKSTYRIVTAGEDALWYAGHPVPFGDEILIDGKKMDKWKNDGRLW